MSPIISLWGFSRRSKAANSIVQGPIWPKFEPIRDIISVLAGCKNEEDPIKNEGARVVTTLFIDFSDAQGKLTPKSVMDFEVSDGILLKFKLIQAFMVGLVTCKNEEDPSKNEGTRVVITFLPL